MYLLFGIVSQIGVCIAARLVAAQTTPLTGSHTDIPRWCGKPYMKGSPNFEPGGMLEPPASQPSEALFIQIAPRYSIYVDGEETGELIVDASFSSNHGRQDNRSGSEGQTSVAKRSDHQGYGNIVFNLSVKSTGKKLVSNQKTSASSAGSLFEFDLTLLSPRLQPYEVVLNGRSSGQGSEFTASTTVYYLPKKTTGSMVKIDNLYGGMLFANNVSDYDFQPLLPFGFYTSCSEYLNNSFANISAYRDLGFTAINPVCALTDVDIVTDPKTGQNMTLTLDYLFDQLDEVNIPFQYDMRGSFYNLSSVESQVSSIKDHSALLSWYTADEPDGWEYSFASVTDAYSLLRQLDPYHPVGLVLNCANYYFKEYTIGATDYIMEDAYPVGIDPDFSRRWNTTCNITYGDCGCDDCIGSLTDVSMRLDSFYEYQSWIATSDSESGAETWQKPLWAVPQAFSGEDYWSRDPTVDESWVMNLLAFNHRAKAIMAWDFPTSDVLREAFSQMAKVFTVSPVSDFILGCQPRRIEVSGHPMLDVAWWQVDEQIMVALVNLDSTNANELGVIKMQLPCKASVSVVKQPWGSLSWKVEKGQTLYVENIKALSTSVVILDVHIS